MNTPLNEPMFQTAFQNKSIHIVATASGTTPEMMAKLHEFITSTNLTIHMPNQLLSNDIPYHASLDTYRLEQLKTALYDPTENNIIWTLRGGYGSARLLDALQTLPIPDTYKTFIGFSDNTALHLFLSQQWGWKTIHGSGFTQLFDSTQDPENFRRITNIISQKNPESCISNLMPLNNIAQKNLSHSQSTTITGHLTGGNLTVLESSIGTHWEAQTAGKILFLEEVNEKGYRIDRSLYHLYQAGLLQTVKAIVLGEFSSPPNDSTIPFALNRFAQEMDTYQIPIYKTNQFGHGNKNYPLIYNAQSEISVDLNNEKAVILRMKV